MMSDRSKIIQKNLKHLIDDINNKATLVAVSKTYPIEDIKHAYQFGQRDFGENKVQDLNEKSIQASDLGMKIDWHFIGHLQSNKVSQLFQVNGLKYIHSLDRKKLLNEFIKHEEKLSEKVKVFVQVNTSDEGEKSGVTDFSEVKELLDGLSKSKKLIPYGLMTIGKIRTDNFEQDAINCFQKLCDLKIKLSVQYDLKLSMGMSSDYAIALKFGADYLRIGSQIFGNRT